MHSLEWKPDGDNNKGTLETTRKGFSLIERPRARWHFACRSVLIAQRRPLSQPASKVARMPMPLERCCDKLWEELPSEQHNSGWSAQDGRPQAIGSSQFDSVTPLSDRRLEFLLLASLVHGAGDWV